MGGQRDERGRGSSGTNEDGGAARRTTRKPWKTMTNHIRTHQECPELVQEAPQMPHDLAEPLFKPFRQHSFAPTPRARPSPSPSRGALFSLQTPASGSRTQEPLTFPGRTHHPTSDDRVG